MKVSIAHADTCLADYWGGDSRPHLQIPARNGMTFADVRRELEDEIRQGAVAGNDENARLLSADLVRPDEEKRADKLTRKVYAAIHRDIRPRKKGARNAFPDLERVPDDFDGDEPCAFFVILIED